MPAAAAPARSAPPIATAIPRRVASTPVRGSVDWRTSCIARLPGQRLLQFEQRITDVAQPVGGVLLQTPAQQPRHRGRRIGRQSRPIRLSCEDGRQRIGEGRGRERRAAGEHVVQHASERPDIGTAIDLPSARLFGAHIRCGSEDDARGRAVPGQRRRGCARIGGGADRQRLGKTEVQDLDRAGLSDFDVRRLQIAMDDAAIMRRFDTAGDLKRIAERLTNGEGAGAKSLGQCLARHELEHQHADIARLFETVDGRDVGVVERCQEPRFTIEPQGTVRIRRQVGAGSPSGQRRVRAGNHGRGKLRPCRLHRAGLRRRRRRRGCLR